MTEISEKLLSEIEFEIEQSRAIQAKKCENHAPFIAFPNSKGQWFLAQGCCNSWNCARCGQIRARAEYGRIVNGARVLSENHNLYFVTITCRGADLDLETSDDNYLKWTNRLFSTWRARTKKQSKKDPLQVWSYVQVTERQQRGAAHSHIICCSVPDDFLEFSKGETLPNGIEAKHDCLYSKWFVNKNISAGLGHVCDITVVRNPIAVAVYIAKYLFKDAQITLWPKGWKRIRYAQSWPKLEHESSGKGFPVLRAADWFRVSQLQEVIAKDNVAYERALSALCENVLPPRFEDKNESVIDDFIHITALDTDEF